MAMRLLDKKQIDSQKAVERSRDVQEGLKLARRVDSLREIQAREEKTLQEYRTKTLATIHEEISKETERRDALKKEVKVLEDRKKEALKPLTEELKRIEDQNKVLLEAQRADIESEGHALARTRERTATESRLAALEKRRAASERERSRAGLLEAESARKEARDVLQEARGIRDSAVQLKKEVEKELRERDVQMASRERDLGLREEENTKERAALAEEWKLLDDRKQMLARALKSKK